MRPDLKPIYSEQYRRLFIMQRRSIVLITALLLLVVSSGAQNTQNLENLAWEKLAAGDADGAIADFTRVIDRLTRIDKPKATSEAFAPSSPLGEGVRVVEPAAASAFLGRGRAYITKRQLDEAISDFDRAIAV